MSRRINPVIRGGLAAALLVACITAAAPVTAQAFPTPRPNPDCFRQGHVWVCP